MARNDTPPFRGIPTRTGRVIVFLVAAALAGFGLFMLGLGVLGPEAGLEKLAPLLCGSAFLLVGLLLLRPVFPGAVNALNHARSPAVRWLNRSGGHYAFRLLIAIVFFSPILMATGIIPSQQPLPAPRWIAVLASSVFMLAGLFWLGHPYLRRLPAPLRRRIQGLFPLLIVTAMAVITDWAAFGSGGRVIAEALESGNLGLAWPGSGSTGRIVIGFSGLVLSLISLLGWWTYLRNDD